MEKRIIHDGGGGPDTYEEWLNTYYVGISPSTESDMFLYTYESISVGDLIQDGLPAGISVNKQTEVSNLWTKSSRGFGKYAVYRKKEVCRRGDLKCLLSREVRYIASHRGPLDKVNGL